MSGRLFRNLVESFSGPVYPINPRVEEIDSIRAYPSILDLPEAVDLAIVAVPAVHVVSVVSQCLEKGVRGLVLITAGFSEVGGEGPKRQAEVLALVRSRGIRMVGPNCLGVLNTDPAARLDGTFSGFPFPRGNVGVCTQSGALGFVIPDLLRAYQSGLSVMVSMGNKADVGENDLLAFWENDPCTEVCLLYLESFQDPRGFLEVARRVSSRKPVVVLKAGRTSAGIRVAGSHTAALASPDSAADAVLRQAGAIRVEDLQEFFEISALLATQPIPAGRRVAVLTNAGGPGVLCADALEAHGLCIAPFSSELREQLRPLVRPEAQVSNPVDLVGSNDPDLFARCLRLLLASREFDTLLVMFVPIRPGDSSRIARAVFDVRQTVSTTHTMLAIFVEAQPPASELADHRLTIPLFTYPERAARALASAVAYGEMRRRGSGTITEPGRFDHAAVQRIVESRMATGDDWLPQPEVQDLLLACGLPVPRWGIAGSVEDAAELAARLGGSVVAKVNSPTVLHKKASGGVIANLRGDQEVCAAYARLVAKVPDTRGVFIQELVAEGLEVLIGVIWDPTFGHQIGCGLGGSLVEALGRVAFRLLPLTDHDAEDLVQESTLARLLPHDGRSTSNGRVPLVDALLRISALVTCVPQIVEADLNPIRIFPDGSLSVLDARFRLHRVTADASDSSPAIQRPPT